MNRICVSLTLLLALSCPARGMQSLQGMGSGSGFVEATIGSRTSHGTGSGAVTTTTTPRSQPSTGQSAQPQLASNKFPHEIWGEIISSYSKQVEPLSHANMGHLPLVSRTWRDVLNDKKYGVVIDVSTWSLDRISDLIIYYAENPNKAYKVLGLDCHSNLNITDAILQTIVAFFPHLESLNLSGCCSLERINVFSGVIPNEFGVIAKLTNLKKLNVDGANICSAALQDIVRANPKLEELNLHSCRWLSENDFSCLKQLTMLKKLDVSHTNINAAGLQAIVNANPELEELNIEGVNDISGNCQLPVDALVCIARLTKLKKLSVGNTNINATTLQAIVDTVHGLEELDLYGCDQLLGEDFGCIAQLKKLKKLNVRSTKIDAAALQAIVSTNPGLEELNLHYCTRLSGMNLAHIERLTNLKKLDVGDTDISAAALRSIADTVHSLEELNLYCCARLSALDLAHIAQLTNLKKLDVGYADISAAVLLAIVMSNPNLEELHLYSVKLRGNAFGHIARLKKLKKLNVGWTWISAAALNAIVRANQDLEKLTFPGGSIDKATIGTIGEFKREFQPEVHHPVNN